jgi:hypothetical protein
MGDSVADAFVPGLPPVNVAAKVLSIAVVLDAALVLDSALVLDDAAVLDTATLPGLPDELEQAASEPAATTASAPTTMRFE